MVAFQNRNITANDSNTARSLRVPRKGSNVLDEFGIVAAVPKPVVQIEIECQGGERSRTAAAEASFAIPPLM